MKKASESGNILFIILIAVALFAALSYAVTNSTRLGNKNISDENNRLIHAGLQNYIVGLKGTVDRMVVGGISLEDIDFTSPTSNYSNISAGEVSPFHPIGGKYPIYNANPSSVFSFDFILSNQIDGAGTSTANSNGNEILLIFYVSENFCKYINTQNGNGSVIPDVGFFLENAGYGGTMRNLSVASQGPYSLPVEGCLKDSQHGSGNDYVYYYVLYAR